MALRVTCNRHNDVISRTNQADEPSLAFTVAYEPWFRTSMFCTNMALQVQYRRRIHEKVRAARNCVVRNTNRVEKKLLKYVSNLHKFQNRGLVQSRSPLAATRWRQGESVRRSRLFVTRALCCTRTPRDFRNTCGRRCRNAGEGQGHDSTLTAWGV